MTPAPHPVHRRWLCAAAVTAALGGVVAWFVCPGDEPGKNIAPKPHSTPAPLAKSDEENLEEVRYYLNGFETAFARLNYKEMGDKVLPYFERLLADPTSTRMEIERIFIFLRLDMGHLDRSRFVEPAVEHLTHPELDVRHSAVMLLREIGSDRDTPPVVALLYDSEKVLRHAAADCLSKIGGKRDVAALNIWLAASQKEEWKTIRHVRECRNELENRLAKEKAEKK